MRLVADLRTILIGIFHIYLKCSTISLTLPYFFKSKEIEESLVEVKKEVGLRRRYWKYHYGNDKAYKTFVCESSL